MLRLLLNVDIFICEFGNFDTDFETFSSSAIFQTCLTAIFIIEWHYYESVRFWKGWRSLYHVTWPSMNINHFVMQLTCWGGVWLQRGPCTRGTTRSEDLHSAYDRSWQAAVALLRVHFFRETNFQHRRTRHHRLDDCAKPRTEWGRRVPLDANFVIDGRCWKNSSSYLTASSTWLNSIRSACASKCLIISATHNSMRSRPKVAYYLRHDSRSYNYCTDCGIYRLNLQARDGD